MCRLAKWEPPSRLTPLPLWSSGCWEASSPLRPIRFPRTCSAPSPGLHGMIADLRVRQSPDSRCVRQSFHFTSARLTDICTMKLGSGHAGEGLDVSGVPLFYRTHTVRDRMPTVCAPLTVNPALEALSSEASWLLPVSPGHGFSGY